MMKGIRSSAAVALLATAARAAEEVVEQVATQAPEAVKQAVTNENAAGYLASALNMFSQCPSFVSETLTATVGENPYARAAAAATTAAIGLGTAYLAFSSCGKRKVASNKPNAQSADSVITDVVQPSSSTTAPASSSSQHSSDEQFSAEGEVGERKPRSRSASPKLGRGQNSDE